MARARRLSPIYVEPRMPRAWDHLVVLATAVAVALLLAEMGLPLASAAAEDLASLDLALCGFFLADFGVRLHLARGNRLTFARKNWIDLVGAIPMAGPLRAARLVRVMRLVRLTRLFALSRRLVRGSDLGLPTRALANLSLVALAVWVTAASLFFFFEEGQNPNVRQIEDALWWSMTTLSTVGYGDIAPTTVPGRIIAATTMVLGVGVLGTLAATFASGLIELRDRGRRGLRSYAMKDHLLVLGWNDRAPIAVDDFRFDPRYHDMPVLVVAELESGPMEGLVRFVRGRPSHREALLKASAERAAVVMAFASDPNDPRSDHETALAVHALRRLNPSARVGAELVDPQNREHLEAAGCDSMVNVSIVAARLLLRSVQDLGVCELVEDLLTNKGGSELYRVGVDPAREGPTYRDYVVRSMDARRTVVALLRDGAILVHPEPSLALAAGDEAFVISEDPPD